MEIIKESRIKKCPECTEQFEANRLDQKFCCRRCRNRSNNRKVRIVNYDTQKIDRILHSNYRILKNVGQIEMAKSQLADLGFNFKYITNLQRTTKGNSVFVLYDYAYYFKNNNKVQIVKPKNT